MSQKNNTTNIAIIGAGASGLFCALCLAKKGFLVTVFEKNNKPGKKLAATGNGKCNISNTNISLANYFSSNPSFSKYALEHFGFEKFSKFCDEIGLNLTTNENGKTYPSSLQASSVVEILYQEALFYGAIFHFSTYIEDLTFEKKAKIIAHNTQYEFDKVILATGSIAMEKLGGTNSGYELAKKLGHSIIEPFPSLVQLTSHNKEIHFLSGVKTEVAITIFINNQRSKSIEGDILFTNYGVSGNAILDLSREANQAMLEGSYVDIVVDLFPQNDKNKLLALLEKKKKALPNRPKEFLLLSLINSKLIDFIFKKAKIDPNKITTDHLDKKDLQSLTYALKSIKIEIDGSKGFENAEVVAGGVNVDEIDPKTMESKLQSGLYFCGEVIDVDGDCGGYNLHWAWASGYILASSMS